MARQVGERYSHPSPLPLGVAAFFVLLACAGLAAAADTTPPALAVYSPADAARLLDDRPIVFGAAERGALVTVNGVAVSSNPFDGTFEVRDLTLASAGSACEQAAAITVVARDDAGNTATVVRTVTANFCGTHPRLRAALPEVRVALGQTGPVALDLGSYFSDDGGADGLVFSTYASGAGISVAYASGALAFTWGPAAATGTYDLAVTARDRDGETSDTAHARLVVEAASSLNQAPTLSAVQVEGPAAVGGTTGIHFDVLDADGDDLVVGGTPLTPGLSVSAAVSAQPGSWRIGVQADVNALPGIGYVRVTATDDQGAVASLLVAVQIYDASAEPALALVASSVPEVYVSQLELQGAVGTGIWADFTTARFVGSVVNFAPGQSLVGPATSARNDERTYWTTFVPLPSVPGTYTRELWAGDRGLPATAYAFTWTVLADPSPPTLLRIQPITGSTSFTEGEPFALQPVGDVPDPGATTYTWTVDGETASHDEVFEGTALSPGTHTVTVTASGPGGSSSASTTLTVSPRSTTIAPRPGTPWLLWLGIAGFVVVGLILGGTEVGVYFVLAGLIGAVIDRKNREKLLTHFLRGRIYQIIEYEPGIHLSELQRQAGVARGVCAYHLHALEKAGLVKTTREGMYLRFFATKVKIDAEAYTLAADDKAVLDAIEAKPGITEMQVAEILGRSSGQVARSVKLLAQSGYVEARREGGATQLFARTQRGEGADGAPGGA